MRADIQPALSELAGLDLIPDLLYVDGSHDADSVYQDVSRSRWLFPDAVIMGDDWPWTTVREGLDRTGFEFFNNGIAWVVLKGG
jgi:hypothetical protein